MSLHEPAPGLHVRSLSKSFGSVLALDDLTLDFDSGKVTALLGPNGAGKTTLLKVILGLVHPDEGIVEVGRRRATDASGAYRHEIGFMPQLPHFPARMTGRELAVMLDDLRDFEGVADEELVHAFGLEADLDKPFGTLSGGTRQKVNAALAFRYPTPLLILDEPTAGLDPVASLALKDKVRRCRQEGRTIVVTSHKLGDLQSLADDVVFLHEGRARFRGSLTTLLDATGRDTLEEAIADLMTGRPVEGRPWSGSADTGPAGRQADEDPRPALRLVP
ncbi:MAG: ABC transporter ATP-binding protein [Longimicrobiales bacterium]|nr:ABC transporter ATP-binding protein [Longimicrobiales bacterium]